MNSSEKYRQKYIAKDVEAYEVRGDKGNCRTGKITTDRNDRNKYRPVSLKFTSTRTDRRENVELLMDDNNAIKLVRHLLVDTKTEVLQLHKILDILLMTCPLNDTQRLAIVRKIIGEEKQAAKKTG